VLVLVVLEILVYRERIVVTVQDVHYQQILDVLAGKSGVFVRRLLIILVIVVLLSVA
jgi:hypothetical protein